MNKKGFTLVELLATIIILGVLAGIASVAYSRYIDDSKKKSYKDAEVVMKQGADSFYTYCASYIGEEKSFCKPYPSFNSTDTLTITELVTYGFMDKVKDPSNQGGYCDGYIKATNKSKANVDMEYKVCLKCNGYQSTDCE